MSATIDQRVVEMRFDNKQFERGVSETMSTLEKLKQRLNFKGAVKGVESVNSAAKGVNANMSGLGSAVEQVSLKFSALQVMGVTALSRLTNSAITAGTRIAKALTIDPITTGFQEYETQINAVQTILANTSHAGTTIKDVNKALDDLNKYADMTIYNFTEMTRNIGTFTAAGVDLETSTSAIKGIANLAAVSGSTSQQASTAMYQLSQALAAGRVSLMDWNSVVNAGMGGKVFQDALTRTADVMNNGAASKAIKEYGSFRESLTKGEWLSTDVLTETLNQFTMAAEEGSEQWNKFKAELKEKGYTDEQATAILKMANTATDAATKVKTFTQLWDVLKESAQSGWTQTWELIIGDYEEAKNLLTPISDALTGLIGKFSEFRNAILESALGRTFSSLGDKFDTIFDPVEKAMDVASGAAEAISDLGTVVEDVIGGKFGNGADRFQALTEAGVNYYKVQNKINEQLGCSKRYSQEQIEAQDKLLGTQTKITEKTEEKADATEEETEATVKLTEAQKKQLIEMSKLSDAELRQKGYTWEQIEALRELQKVADNLGIPFDKFINQLDEINGRWLLINSFKNIGNALADVGRAIGKAWKDVFPEHSIEFFADKLFNLLGSFHRITSAMADLFYVKIGEKGSTGEAIYKLTEAGEKLVRTFKGVFAIVDLVATVVGGGFKVAFKIASELFGRFGLSILDVTAVVGDAIVGFRDFMDSILNVSGIVDFLVPLIKSLAHFIIDLTNAVKNSKWFGDFCNYINTAADGLGSLFNSIPDMSGFKSLMDALRKAKTIFQDWIQVLKGSENIPKDIIAGLAQGISADAPDVIAAVFELAKNIISGICTVLGIHSPSTVMIAIGGFIIAGLIKGITSGETDLISVVDGLSGDIWTAMKAGYDWLKTNISGLFKGFWDFITDENGNVQWGSVFAGGVTIGSLWILKQFATAFKGLTDGLGGIGDLLENAADAMKSVKKAIDAYSWDLKAEALKKMAIAIAILVAAIVVLAQIEDVGKLWNAVGIIAVLAVVLVGLAWAMDKFTTASASIGKDGASIDGLKTGLLQIALSIGILAFVVKMIGDMDAEKAKAGFKGLVGIAVGMVVFMAALAGISKFSGNTSGLSKTMLGMAISIGAMLLVVKMISRMDPEDLAIGILGIQMFLIMMAEMAAINRISGANSGIGKTMLAMALSMAIMLGIVKIISKMDPADIVIGILAIQAFMLLMLEMAGLNAIGGPKNKLGGTILSMTLSMLLLIGVIKLASTLDLADVVKGTIAIQAFLVLIAEMLLISKLGKDTTKVAATILSMALTIAIMAGVAVLLSMVDTAALFKGIVAVGALSMLMAMMTKSLKGAQNAKGAIMWMAIGIGILAASAVALSFIPIEKLLPAVGALSVMMISFGVMAKLASKIKTNIPSLLMMLGVVVLLASIVAALSLLNVGHTIEIAASISLLMLTMGATMAIISAVGPLAMSGLGALAIMALIVGGLGLIVGLLEKWDLAPSIATAASLSLLLVVMSASLILLSIVGATGPAAFIGIGALAVLIAGIGGLIIGIGALMDKFPRLEEFLNRGIPILEKIGSAIGSFYGNIIGGFVKGLTDDLPEIVENIRLFVEGLGGVSAAASKIEPGAFDGVGGMVKAMLAISIGSLVEHFASSLTGESSMESFKTNAITFVGAIAEISSALNGVTINDDQIALVTKCGTMFAKLNKSLPRSGGVLQDYLGEKDLGTFSQSCLAFVATMIRINNAVSGEGFEVQSERISAIVAAGERFNELQNALPRSGGMLQDFVGEKELGPFALACRAFTMIMRDINLMVSGDDFVIQTDRIDAIVTAGEAFARLNEALPRSGGFAQDFAGEKELGPFGESCAAFASVMIAVNEAVSAEGFTVNTDAIGQLCTAGAKFNELQNALPKTGGWWQEIAGKQDLEDFGGKIKAYGTAISEYSSEISTVDTGAINVSINIAHRIKTLIESLAGLDTSGLTTFTGIGTGGFGADGAAYKIAKTMSKYGEEIAGIDVSAVSVSATVATKLKNLISGLVGLDTSGIDSFKPAAIGTAMKTYADKVSGIDTSTVSSSASSANKLKKLIESLAGLDTSGVGPFKNALSELGTVDISNVVKAFSNAGPRLSAAGSSMMNGLVKGIQSKSSMVHDIIDKILSAIDKRIAASLPLFEKAGNQITSKIAKGISDKKTAMKSAVQACSTTAATSIRSHYTAFYDAGSYLVTGFANGISANMFRATAKAKAMAEAAEKAARDALKINSPSKVFKEIGAGIPEGFALGIKTMTTLIDKPLANMSGLATKSVSDTVSKLAAAIDSDVDVQPTIRPVLDLSNIRSGAGAISGMLGVGSSVGVLASVGSISRSMNARGQNVSNADVVSAIDRLDRHLDNVGNTTYTIGGITYDDGSNIAIAVKDLTRYARMERRV